MFERFNSEDRVLMMFATQEARDLGHRGLGNDHLILGMLGNARSPLFSLLSEHGLRLEPAREVVRAYHEDHSAELDDAEATSAADRYEEDREALKSIGIDLDKVRAAVSDRFDEDLADGWGERSRRGRGRGHGRGCGEHGRRRGHGRGRGGFGPEGFGPEGFGPGFSAGAFGPGFGAGTFGPVGFVPGFDPREGEGPWEGGRGRRGPRGRRGRARVASTTREALATAVRLAREHGGRTLRAEYLLLGILETGDPASTALIESATTVDSLREAVLATVPEVPADA